MEFPVIEFLGTQFVVGAEGTGGGPALDYLITFSSHCFPCRHAQHLAGGLIQVQKLIGADIADIGIAFVCIEHRPETMVLLLKEPVHLFLFSGKSADIGKFHLKHRASLH